MIPLFQLSTRNYEKEITIISNALKELEKECNVTNGYELGEPSNMAGWTFFNLKISPEMHLVIETSGMMEGALGYRIGEQIKNFLGHYFELRGSQIRIKQIGY